MEKSKMRNMIVLKDLPSNLVDEAIVFLKPNKDSKRLEKIDKEDKEKEKKKKDSDEIIYKEKDYIIKDAEMLISNYILKLENKNKQKQYKNKDIKNNSKYIMLRNYSYIASIIILLQAALLVIK